MIDLAQSGGMSVMTCPDHLLTLEEFDQLPEDNSRRYELQEGVLQVSPKAAGFHQFVLDPEDPFPEGFQLSDTWGAGAPCR